MRMLVALVLSLQMAVGCALTDDRRLLSASEIQELFAGATVTGRHEVRGYTFKSFYQADGHFRSHQGGATTPREGTWWVVEPDEICIRWSDTRETFCRHMATDGQRHWKVASGSRRNIVTFESFE